MSTYLPIYHTTTMLSRTCIYLIILLFFLLSGCANTTKPTIIKSSTDLVEQAKKLAEKGQYREAAQVYIRLANKSHQPAQQGYQLIAVENFLKAGLLNDAKAELARIDFNKSLRLEIPHELVLAWIDLVENRATQARNRLGTIQNPASLPTDKRITYYELLAQALAATGNVVEAVKERITLENFLQSEHANAVEITRNREALWQTLYSASENTLKQMSQTRDEVLSGWIALALVTKTVSPRHLKQSVDNWQLRYPEHPATKTIVADLLHNTQIAQAKVREIALLLPLKGTFKEQAEAVRDGFLAAWYNENEQRAQGQQLVNVTVHEATEDNILQVYESIIQSGVDFVVGPLEKGALDKLANRYSQLPAPTLGLNYLTVASNPGNLYQFGLSPEDEAIAAAKQAWADGHRNALVLIPESTGDWGERILNAFQTTWTSQGGKIVKTAIYTSQPQSAVKKLLTLSDPVDMAFVVAFPQLARQIRPYFQQYYTVRDLPIYSTSHVYGGTPNPREDQDLNGIKFTDMPWILAPNAAATKLQATLQKYWPSSMTNYRRLYAFGIDAFQVLPNLSKLLSQQWSGQTGFLYLDHQGAIHRQLLWAQFVDGIPFLLRENANLINPVITSILAAY